MIFMKAINLRNCFTFFINFLIHYILFLFIIFRSLFIILYFIIFLYVIYKIFIDIVLI